MAVQSASGPLPVPGAGLGAGGFWGRTRPHVLPSPQRGGHRGAAERGPRGRAAGGAGLPGHPGAGPGGLGLVPGQQAVPPHRLRGHGHLCAHGGHTPRHQVPDAGMLAGPTSSCAECLGGGGEPRGRGRGPPDPRHVPRYWNGVVPERCRHQFKDGEEWNCFFGYKVYPTLRCEGPTGQGRGRGAGSVGLGFLQPGV